MGVLSRTVVIALVCAGCYQPTVTDCRLTCAAADECAGDQVCADGWCVAPSAVGTCEEAPPDSGADDDATLAPDAVPIDASGPDAAVYQLHVIVQGRGKVVVDPLGVECVGVNGAPGDCTYDVAADSMQTLLPVETHPQDAFAGWSTANCSAAPAACTLTIDTAVVLVGATFE